MRWLLVIGLVGCGKGTSEPGELVWMEGFAYEWVHFNHRLSYLEVAVDDAGVRASVVGGTSTTGVDASLPQECDPDTCDELPFADEAAVTIGWGRATDATATATTARAAVTADADGDTTTVSASLPGAGDGSVAALITGVRWTSDSPLTGGPDCYDPAFGWLPTRLTIDVGEPVASGDDVSVDVSAAIEVGNTMEAARACIDAVIDRATAGVEVDVLLIVGDGAAAEQEIGGAATFTYGDGPLNPDPQTMPDATAVQLGLDGAAIGWRSMDWRFHIDDPERRGAYLRRLELLADDATARGGATNYSPVTQLSAFDYAFSGILAGVETGGAVSRGRIDATLPVELEDDGTPVVQDLGLPW